MESKLQHCVLLVPSPGAKSPNSCSGLEGHDSASWERPGHTSDNSVGLWYTDRLCAEETLSLSSEGLIQYNSHHYSVCLTLIPKRLFTPLRNCATLVLHTRIFYTTTHIVSSDTGLH